MEVLKSEIFESWLNNLRDERAKERITERIYRAALGNFGKFRSVGGGDKSSQDKDVKQAQELAKEIK